VGRSAEFAAIRTCFNRLVDGQGGILSVIGEAGLGKSRLIAEIRHHFESENLLWLEGRTLSYGQKISYWPFKEILRQYAGITEDDGDAEAWGKFETKITGLFGETTNEILPYLASRMVGWAHYHLGNFAEAATEAQELIRFGEDANDPQVRCWGLVVLGMSQYGMGRLHEAVSTLREAVEIAKTVPDQPTHGVAGGYLGKCYVRLGNFPIAFATLRDTEAFARSHGARGAFNVTVDKALAEALLSAAERGTGSEKSKSMRDTHLASRRALKGAKAFLRSDVPEAVRHRGTYEWLATKPSAAQKWWMRSLSVADETGMRYESGMTHLETGRRLKDPEHLRQAETIFIEIGAEWDLAETRRLLERFQT
jgi:tetratricopeptide (TPR) repeat protein